MPTDIYVRAEAHREGVAHQQSNIFISSIFLPDIQVIFMA